MPNRSENAEVAVLQDWRTRVDESLERIEKKIDSLDTKYAAKWVQTIVAGLVGAVLLGLITVIIGFFIPNKFVQQSPSAQNSPNIVSQKD